MNAEECHRSLQEFAKQLRPVSRSAFVPLIRIANKAGIEIELEFYSNQKRREAQVELNPSRPRILLYRRSTTNGRMKVTLDREHLLTPRERFSVAHELGHFFAYKEFGALPVFKEKCAHEYRLQEKCMNEFAQALLVPDWLVQTWLSSVHDDAIWPQTLRFWAFECCRVSTEVVTRALARLRSDMGFIKVADALRVASGKRILVVFYSAYGTELRLPNVHSFIEDDRFVDKFEQNHGAEYIDECWLGSAKLQNCKIAWQEADVLGVRKRQEFVSSLKLSGKGYWVSIRRRREDDNHGAIQAAQLSLF